jgi:hypothetical protein
VQNMSRNDAPAALVMGIGFLAFGLTMILQPDNVRANFDRFADSWKPGSWHPYRMPSWALRLAGAIAIAVATLFFYIAFVAFNR